MFNFGAILQVFVLVGKYIVRALLLTDDVHADSVYSRVQSADYWP